MLRASGDTALWTRKKDGPSGLDVELLELALDRPYHIVRNHASRKEGALSSATVTSKGQITIPRDVRERLGLEAGDRVVFVVQSDRDVTMKPAKTDVRELHGMLSRKDRRRRSVEEMDEGIVRAIAEKHARRR